MKQEFLIPHFTGARFDEHTLPVELGRDLAAYQELIIELAKHLYRVDNPGRERVPKGFEKNFSLHLEGMIEDGSARPLLAWVLAGGLAWGDVEMTYFTRARDLAAQTVNAVAENRAIPEQFPRALLGQFNVFGRSLKEGETVDIGGSTVQGAVLTPAVRKRLVLEEEREYTKDVEIRGTIEEADYVRSTFRLRRLDGGGAVVVSMPKAFGESVRTALGKERVVVKIKGAGRYNARDEQQGSIELEHLDLLPNQLLADQVEALGALPAGWLDGEGVALDSRHLEWLSSQLVARFPEDLPFPYVAALPSGGVFLEWIENGARISAEIPPGSQVASLHSLRLRDHSTTAGEARIGTDAGLDQLFAFVRAER